MLKSAYSLHKHPKYNPFVDLFKNLIIAYFIGLQGERQGVCEFTSMSQEGPQFLELALVCLLV